MELTWGVAEREAKEKGVAALSSLDRDKQRFKIEVLLV